MRKCPFCDEEIQEEAKKCKHCKEWLNEKPNNVGHSQNAPNNRLTERILCEDGSCVGVLDQRGICEECRRTPEEVKSGVENKNWERQLVYQPVGHSQNAPNNRLTERILCEDGSCIGVLDQRGICKECGRTPEEVKSGVENKNWERQLVYPPVGHSKSQSGNWISCPLCRGKAFGGRGCLVIGLIIITFPVGLLFLLIKPTYKCQSCGYTLKV